MAAAVLFTVKAVKDFPFRDRLVRAGELVAMRAPEAAAHARLGRVSLTRPPRPAVIPGAVLSSAVEAETPAPAPAAEARRRYRRRDLQPEP